MGGEMVLEPEPKRGPGGAERQTSATADKHGSVSRGGGGEKEGGGGVKPEMRHWGVLPNPAVVREDMAGLRLEQLSPLLYVTKLLRRLSINFSARTYYCFISLM